MSLLPLLSLFVTGNDDWTGWRGPHGDGKAAGSPPLEWSETRNVRWKSALPGEGLSTPVVRADRVFLTCAVPTGKTRPGLPFPDAPRAVELAEQQFLVLALDRADGKVLWRKEVQRAFPHEGTHPENTYATPTPAADDERLYCSFGSFGLFALTNAGEVAWQVDLGDLINQGHGEGSSPLLHDGKLIQLWAQRGGDGFLVALEAASGKELWRTPVPRGNNCSTPVVVRVEGQDQIVIGGYQTSAFEPASGRRLWSFGEPVPDGGVTMASPVSAGELLIVPGQRLRAGSSGTLRALVVTPGGEGPEELWSLRSDDNIPSPLLHDEHLYFVKDGSAQLTVWNAATGEVEYGPERLEGVGATWASPVLANGHLYVVGREGTTAVLSLAPEVEVLARNVLPDAFDASPAVAGNELFLRGKQHLWCVGAPAR